MAFENNLSFAQHLDDEDPLRKFRARFYFPKTKNGEAVYLCGNSLGLQPKSVLGSIKNELDDWANLAVDGHINAKTPWAAYHRSLTKTTAKLVGAKSIEVTTISGLTTNLNSLLISFYRPTKKRFKIITEHNPFSSDSYMLESQVKLHGLNPAKTIIEVKPRKNEFVIREEDILNTIKQNSKELALVFFGGVHFYTGQAFDIKAITEAAHKAGAIAGFDLAHAAGNIKLDLHKWNVDFAAWCTYKYLNAGPGTVGQIFVHEKYTNSKNLPRLAGWWGHDEKERFLMKKGFKPVEGAEGWAQSNDNVLSMASLKASLEIFDEAGIKNLVKKSQLMTAYLEYLINIECNVDKKKNKHYKIKIITPSAKEERGCQLSILVEKNGKHLYDLIRKNGFVIDYRNPDVIRITPVPLYNSFEDVYQIAKLLSEVCYL